MSMGLMSSKTIFTVEIDPTYKLPTMRPTKQGAYVRPFSKLGAQTRAVELLPDRCQGGASAASTKKSSGRDPWLSSTELATGLFVGS